MKIFVSAFLVPNLSSVEKNCVPVTVTSDCMG